jgi:hypothetical protein
LGDLVDRCVLVCLFTLGGFGVHFVGSFRARVTDTLSLMFR